MTRSNTSSPGLLSEISTIATNIGFPHHEPPSVIRRRRIVVAVVVVCGAALLSYSLAREPGATSFYWLTLALAAVWTVGAFVSGPLHLGCIRWRGRNQRPVITGTTIGLLLGGVFLLGGLVAREIPVIAELVTRVLIFANQGALPLIVLITLVNAVAEELFFRGALYTALGRHYPVVISTLLYVAVTSASGNPMLGFAAVILGLVCALARRATGGVLAPLLIHLIWSLVMVLALPPLFGL